MREIVPTKNSFRTFSLKSVKKFTIHLTLGAAIGKIKLNKLSPRKISTHLNEVVKFYLGFIF